ncbi:hypothetical protein [Leifsonia sp. Root227]|uniref:hypothetical protein n=1 Tax=Leifsonia sp. Root227 TaxID=1736496 RepID=UPI0012F8C02F|nr:hypothetical protein [Leifsonia sp. Root227]
MSNQSQIAFQHRSDRVALGQDLVRQVRQLWSFGNVSDLDGSWDALAPRIVQAVTSGQTAAAAQATPFMDAVDRSYGRKPSGGSLVPEAFSGVMLDGREVGPALFSAVTTTKEAIGAGIAPPNAFLAGANALAVVAQAALQDMGRQADITLGRARAYTRYVRVVGAGACSRCGILAGAASSEKAFLRHTGCQCQAMPVLVSRGGVPNIPRGFHDSPEAFFDSLSKVEQDHAFTKAGAEAIRAGANPVSVVNARRGAYGIGYSGHYHAPVPVGTRSVLKPIQIGVKADGTPLRVYATGEGTSARGAFYKSERARGGEAVKEGRYRRSTTIRLMPEQLIQMAGSDVNRLRELLTRYGYMD